MSPTPTNRCPRHRPVGVGDIDLEAVEAHHTPQCLTVHASPLSTEDLRAPIAPNRDINTLHKDEGREGRDTKNQG
ncbi:MAG: hypothetical protein K2H04_02565 [Bacteroidaceae bacterium]|nr:hypothetical protein [Bacteroidaceae bacterium]